MSARSIHAILVAINLFWYQACRQTLGVLTVAMGQELGLSTKEKGWLIAAPSVGNIITQMFGSRVESALGARATIACAVLGLAIGCLLVPIACTASLKLGLLVLAAQGFVFGPMFPAHSVLLSRWLTPADRGPASAQGEIAMSIASMGAPLLIASLETYAGWRAGFYATGSVCLLYVGFGWLRLAASRPSDCAYITKEELALLSASSGEKPPIKTAKGAAVAPDATPTGAPASKVLLHPATLALFACHMAYNLTTLSINSWMPTYYAEVLSFPPEAAKLHLTLPHLTAMILKFGVSRVASRVRLSLGCSMLTTRRIMCAVGYLFTGTPMLFVPALSRSPPWMTTLCFCIALAGTGACPIARPIPLNLHLPPQHLHNSPPPTPCPHLPAPPFSRVWCGTQASTLRVFAPTISTSPVPTWASSRVLATASPASPPWSPHS